MSPTEWYTLLNSHVFFWFDPARLNRQKRACGGRDQRVMIIDCERLLEYYGKHAALTPFNTGNARRKAAVRGKDTFVPYTTWLDSGWDREVPDLRNAPRPRNHKPVELTIPDAVPDIMRFVVEVKTLRNGEYL
ncbi:MAG: hypothetical protein MI724_20945 [Spirochaetales bacterium]|nr:hypothetical protein [Spirochaetales bacterium]